MFDLLPFVLFFFFSTKEGEAKINVSTIQSDANVTVFPVISCTRIVCSKIVIFILITLNLVTISVSLLYCLFLLPFLIRLGIPCFLS